MLTLLLAIFLALAGWFGVPHLPVEILQPVPLVTIPERGNIAARDLLTTPVARFSVLSQGARQHTINHESCEACAAETAGAMGHSVLASLPFPQAAESWLASRKLLLAPRTIHDYQQYIGTLKQFIGEPQLSNVNIGIIRSYQQWRLENGISAPRINMEVGCLRQILKDAKLWHRMQPYYKRLREVGKGPGRAMTREEWAHLREVGNSQGKWFVALYASMLSVNSGAGPGEIRHLRLKDIDFEHRQFSIRRAVKNGYRVRDLPLSPPGYVAMKRLMDRCLEKGGGKPDDHLLPHRADKGGKTWDFSRPQGGWYKAWRNMVNKAAQKCPGLAGLRPYDCRHTFGTRLFSSPTVSERTAVELMGWSDARMAERYNHLTMKVKREAVNAVSEIENPPQKIGPAGASWTGYIMWKNGT